jgi:ABC-2 type transport system permease protein
MVLVIGVYPSFKDQAAELDKSLAQLPDTAKALFSDTPDFLSPVGYLSSQIYYLMLPLILSILSIGLGASLIAREEQEHTIELLLARPISRTGLLVGKALSGLAILVIVSCVNLAVTIPAVWWAGFDGVSASGIIMVTLVCLVLSAIFGTLAFALSAIGHSAKSLSLGIAALVALGGYIISSLESTVEWLRWPSKLFPYHYFHPSEIIGGDFTTKSFVGFIAAVLVLGVVAWIAFRRRDID